MNLEVVDHLIRRTQRGMPQASINSSIDTKNASLGMAIISLFDLPKLLNLVTKLLFVLHGFSTMTSSIKILLFDLPGFNPGFKIILKLLKLPPEVVFRFGF